MNPKWNMATVFGSALLALAAQGSGSGSAPQGLQRVPATTGALDRSAWLEMMSLSDLAQREGLYADLLRQARSQPGAFEELDAWLREEEDEHLAWTLRLALRELEGSSGAFPRMRAFGGPGGRLDLDRWLGSGTPFGRSGPGIGGLEQQLREFLEQHRGGAPRGLPFGQGLGGPGIGGNAAGGSFRSERFQLESGPDGVRVEVHEEGEDGEHVRTYEAESLEKLFEQHPELRDRVDVAPRLPRGEGLQRLFGDFQDHMLRAGEPWVPTDRLGIYMEPPGSWSSTTPGLDGDSGLRVTQVVPGSLAEALGLRPGDVVLELNGTQLESATTVAQVLGARSSDETITAVRIDPSGARSSLAWNPPQG